MMCGLTFSEHNMMKHFTDRLGLISSPVVRSQLLMQISQLLDIAYLGDTSSERENVLVSQVDDLSLRLCENEAASEARE